MKGKHRHELETNALAKWLAATIERARPYGPTVLGVVVAILVFFIVFSYLSRSTTAQQSAAWSAYITAMETPIYTDQVFRSAMELLKVSAEENVGTSMQRWSDVTWADGQVWMASRLFLRDRDAAREALSRAASVYNSLLRSSPDSQVSDRAHFGLGRIYEMQNDLERAKQEYASVRGGFTQLAEARAKQIDDQQSRKELERALDWLTTAEPPRRPSPSGPGVPGRQPELSPGNLQMPAAASGEEQTLEDILGRLETASEAADSDRYDTGESVPPDDASSGESPAEEDTSGE